MVGVLEEVGVSFVAADDSIIIPLAGAEGTIVDRDPDYSQIRVLASGDPSAVSDAITDTLRSTRGVSSGEEDFAVIEATAIISTASDVSGTLTMMITIIGGVSLVIGGLIGILLGGALALGLSTALLDLDAAVSQTAIAGALLVSVIVGIAAGIGPAWQAASVDPTVALRYE